MVDWRLQVPVEGLLLDIRHLFSSIAPSFLSWHLSGWLRPTSAAIKLMAMMQLFTRLSFGVLPPCLNSWVH
jgi:hypothetical protein